MLCQYQTAETRCGVLKMADQAGAAAASKKKKKKAKVGVAAPATTKVAAAKKGGKGKAKKKAGGAAESKGGDAKDSKQSAPFPPEGSVESDGSDVDDEDYSDDEDEGADGYKVGGYHPVSLGDRFSSGRYAVVEKLGWGHFSTVWMSHDKKHAEKETPEFVAIKVQKSATHYREAAFDEIELLNCVSKAAATERAVLEFGPGFDHCVCKLLDHFEHSGPNGKHVCMVFEMLGENLLKVIQKYDYRGIPIPLVKDIVRQILVGLDFLHRHCSIIHTDLKPENILTGSAPKPPSAERVAELLARNSDKAGSGKASSAGGAKAEPKREKARGEGPTSQTIEEIKKQLDAGDKEGLDSQARKKLKKKLKKKRQQAKKKEKGKERRGNRRGGGAGAGPGAGAAGGGGGGQRSKRGSRSSGDAKGTTQLSSLERANILAEERMMELASEPLTKTSAVLTAVAGSKTESPRQSLSLSLLPAAPGSSYAAEKLSAGDKAGSSAADSKQRGADFCEREDGSGALEARLDSLQLASHRAEDKGSPPPCNDNNSNRNSKNNNNSNNNNSNNNSNDGSGSSFMLLPSWARPTLFTFMNFRRSDAADRQLTSRGTPALPTYRRAVGIAEDEWMRPPEVVCSRLTLVSLVCLAAS